MIRFEKDFELLGRKLVNQETVDVGEWQALRGQGIPQEKTKELLNVRLQWRIPPDIGGLQAFVEPNLPWAEDHFQERVSGQPLNPGEQYKNWPWYRGNVHQHQTVSDDEVVRRRGDLELWEGGPVREEERKFSHTYMERFWPKHANQSNHMKPIGTTHYEEAPLRGIRYNYGDLNDVVQLLARSPYTRQAYLPVWFPEDTGAVHGERIPCTLGYHFIRRGDQLHCFYPIRSCDLLRHFRDDVYLAGRLTQWVIDSLRNIEMLDPDRPVGEYDWHNVNPGTLTFDAVSLHIFEGDVPSLRRKLNADSH